MKKDRIHVRRRTSDYYTITDKASGKILGRVGNLSVGGFMLIAMDRLETGKVYQLKMTFPDIILDAKQMSLEGECRWCAQNDLAGWWENGFEIRGLSQEAMTLLQNVIQRFAADEAPRTAAQQKASEKEATKLEYVRDRCTYLRHSHKSHFKS